MSPPPGFPPVPPVPPPPYSNQSVTFPTTADLSYAGIRILNGYSGTVTFPVNISFAEYTQNSGATAQYADTVVSIDTTFGWTGGTINTTSNNATYKLKTVLMGQIGEDNSSLNSGSWFVLDSNASGLGSFVQQAGVLTMRNDAGIEVTSNSTLLQEERLINAPNPPTIDAWETTDSGGVVVTNGEFIAAGGKVRYVRVEAAGFLDVEINRAGTRGGLEVTGKMATNNWGVKSKGQISIRNGLTLKVQHGVYVSEGDLYTLTAGAPTPQIAKIEGELRFEGRTIRLGEPNIDPKYQSQGVSYSTLLVTEKVGLFDGKFEPKLDNTNNQNRDYIETEDTLNIATFTISPTGAGAAVFADVLVSKNGFLNNNDPVNGTPQIFTMQRTNTGKNWGVK